MTHQLKIYIEHLNDSSVDEKLKSSGQRMPHIRIRNAHGSL